MATTVAWHSERLMWMVDNQEGYECYFDDEGAAIQLAVDVEKKKSHPDRVLVYKKEGKGITLNLPVN